MTTVRYGHWHAGMASVPKFLRELLDARTIHEMCDVGGGANPAISPEEIDQRGLNYTLLDISQAELDMAPSSINKVRADVADAASVTHLAGQFDLVFSKTLAEHIRDAEAFHRNVYAMLRPGGIAAHFMPTMYDPMFIANRLLPEGVSRWIVRKAQPDRDLDSHHGKFPAYYRWCRGPSERHLDRFRGLGYTVEEAVGYFGTGYLRRTPLHKPYEAVTRKLIEHPVNALVSYTWLVLRRPAEDQWSTD